MPFLFQMNSVITSLSIQKNITYLCQSVLLLIANPPFYTLEVKIGKIPIPRLIWIRSIQIIKLTLSKM